MTGATGATGATGGGATGPTGTTGATGSGASAAVLTWSTVDQGVAIGSAAYSSLTQRDAWLFQLPYSITVDSITYRRTSGASGTAKVCVYSGDGSTKLIDVTDTAGTGNITVAVSPGVALSPGTYWIIIGCATTCTHAITASNNTSPVFTAASPAPWNGTVTHSSGVCDSALGTVTGSAVKSGMFRFDQ